MEIEVFRPIIGKYKVVLLGNSGVGKTCLINSLLNSKFSSLIPPTIGVDITTIEFNLENNEDIVLKIWDTAGTERYRSITRTFLNDSKGIMIVFDLTNKKSFNAIEHWIDDVKKLLGDDIPILIVGNKSDLVNEREVTTDEISEYLRLLGLSYVEASAKELFNVQIAFQELGRLVLDFDKISKQSMKAKVSIQINPQKERQATAVMHRSHRRLCCSQ